jgi:alkanesulfonate monooxygenase SsuD/methylene tetrahydromethanopterin reductase-like flavin-dependent oxidoreductase (luciferase family)
VITAATEEEARAKHAEYLSYGDPEGALVFMSGWMGVDLSRYRRDEPIADVDSNAILSAVKAFQSADPDGGEWAVDDIATWGKIGGMGPLIVGSGTRVADVLQEWVHDDGRRRLQPRLCDHAGIVRRLHRPRRARTHRTRRVSGGVRARIVAQQALRAG